MVAVGTQTSDFETFLANLRYEAMVGCEKGPLDAGGAAVTGPTVCYQGVPPLASTPPCAKSSVMSKTF